MLGRALGAILQLLSVCQSLSEMAFRSNFKPLKPLLLIRQRLFGGSARTGIFMFLPYFLQLLKIFLYS